MRKLKPDVAIDVYFLTESEGGKRHPIPLTTDASFGCVFQVDGKGFDCRIADEEGLLVPGGRYRLNVKFLFWEEAKKHLSVHKQIQLW